MRMVTDLPGLAAAIVLLLLLLLLRILDHLVVKVLPHLLLVHLAPEASRNGNKSLYVHFLLCRSPSTGQHPALATRPATLNNAPAISRTEKKARELLFSRYSREDLARAVQSADGRLVAGSKRRAALGDFIAKSRL